MPIGKHGNHLRGPKHPRWRGGPDPLKKKAREQRFAENNTEKRKAQCRAAAKKYRASLALLDAQEALAQSAKRKAAEVANAQAQGFTGKLNLSRI